MEDFWEECDWCRPNLTPSHFWRSATGASYRRVSAGQRPHEHAEMSAWVSRPAGRNPSAVPQLNHRIVSPIAAPDDYPGGVVVQFAPGCALSIRRALGRVHTGLSISAPPQRLTTACRISTYVIAELSRPPKDRCYKAEMVAAVSVENGTNSWPSAPRRCGGELLTRGRRMRPVSPGRVCNR